MKKVPLSNYSLKSIQKIIDAEVSFQKMLFNYDTLFNCDVLYVNTKDYKNVFPSSFTILTNEGELQLMSV